MILDSLHPGYCDMAAQACSPIYCPALTFFPFLILAHANLSLIDLRQEARDTFLLEGLWDARLDRLEPDRLVQAEGSEQVSH